MSIEFSCAQCGQKLRVSDEAAGKRAKCPKCSQVNEIPIPPATEDDLRLLPEEPLFPPGGSPFQSAPANPYLAPQAGYYAPSEPSLGGKLGNVPADIASILNYAAALWQKNLGLLIGATLVLFGVTLVFVFLSQVVAHMRLREVGVLLSLMIDLTSQLVGIFLGIGYTRITLKLARNQPVEFDELFRGGPVFLSVLGVLILYALAVGFGLLLCIVPGIIIAMLWWPCYYLVLDRKTTVLESFEMARMIMRGNMGTVILVWLLGAGIGLVGFMACCVGLVAAVPLVAIMKTTAYLMMSGQLPLRPDAYAAKSFV